MKRDLKTICKTFNLIILLRNFIMLIFAFQLSILTFKSIRALISLYMFSLNLLQDYSTRALFPDVMFLMNCTISHVNRHRYSRLCLTEFKQLVLNSLHSVPSYTFIILEEIFSSFFNCSSLSFIELSILFC